MKLHEPWSFHLHLDPWQSWPDTEGLEMNASSLVFQPGVFSHHPLALLGFVASPEGIRLPLPPFFPAHPWHDVQGASLASAKWIQNWSKMGFNVIQPSKLPTADGLRVLFQKRKLADNCGPTLAQPSRRPGDHHLLCPKKSSLLSQRGWRLTPSCTLAHALHTHTHDAKATN